MCALHVLAVYMFYGYSIKLHRLLFIVDQTNTTLHDKTDERHIASNILTPFHAVRSTILHSFWSLTRRCHLLHTLKTP